MRGLETLKLASRCLRTLVQTTVNGITYNVCFLRVDSGGKEGAFVSPDLHCLTSSSHIQGLCTSPTVLLDDTDNDQHDPPRVQGKEPPP
jgi:hypothetical protein